MSDTVERHPSVGSAAPVLNPDIVARAHRPDLGATALRFITFVVLYGLAATAAVYLGTHHPMGWLLALPAYVLGGLALHGISLFTHEAVHGALVPQSRLLNHVFGALCAQPVFQNFAAYRVLHLRHHAHLGVIGDPDHYENYTRRRWLIYAMHWGRLILGYPAYITAIPILGFIQGNAKDRLAIVGESATLGGLIFVAWTYAPTAWLLFGWVGPMVIINTVVNIRGMSQHTLLEHESDVVLGTRTILGSRLSRFFMCNENFHLEHHLYPGVPWHALPEVHDALENALAQRGAPFIPSYRAFVADFVTITLTHRRTGTAVLR